MTEELRQFTGSNASKIAREIEDREQQAIEAWEKEMKERSEDNSKITITYNGRHGDTYIYDATLEELEKKLAYLDKAEARTQKYAPTDSGSSRYRELAHAKAIRDAISKVNSNTQYATDRRYQVTGRKLDLTDDQYKIAKEAKNPAVAHNEACEVITQWNEEFAVTSRDRQFGLDRIYGADGLVKYIALYIKYHGEHKWVQMTNYKEPWDLIEDLEVFESGMRMITPDYFKNNKGGK